MLLHLGYYQPTDDKVSRILRIQLVVWNILDLRPSRWSSRPDYLLENTTKMRVSSLAVAICLTATINDTNARYDEPRSFILSPQQKLPLWGVVSYGGGDASPSSTADEQEEKSAENIDKVNRTTINTSSQILNSVSAGGGSPVDAVMATTSAFVGVSKSTVQKSTTTTTIQRPLGTTETASTKGASSHLSVATNEQKNGEEAAVDEETITSSDSKGNQRRPLKILFLSSDTGGGHRASAEALANQFQRLFPGTTYDLLDIWTDVDSSWPYYTIKVRL